MCHGSHGEGLVSRDGQAAFPTLWGPESLNWGAGMGSITNASEFIRANMPRGRGGLLSEQEAWDVATFIDSQERPQDPRYTGSVADTRAKYHNSASSMYGKVVDGHLLGGDSEAAGGRLRESMSPVFSRTWSKADSTVQEAAVINCEHGTKDSFPFVAKRTAFPPPVWFRISTGGSIIDPPVFYCGPKRVHLKASGLESEPAPQLSDRPGPLRTSGTASRCMRSLRDN